jgi:hypothetical protein
MLLYASGCIPSSFGAQAGGLSPALVQRLLRDTPAKHILVHKP